MMTRTADPKEFPFQRPGTYRIRVIGEIDQNWSDRLGGFSILPDRNQDKEDSVTELLGQVRDQAELSGVLETLYDLHMTILLVEHQDD
ncbi:MAG: hypothetical protein ACR2PB_05250 [Desulfocapsaceae bacterium]